MRSCIYCGKELKKDEKCNCISAVNRRNQAKKKSTDSKKQTAGDYTNFNKDGSNSYHTGYTKHDNPFKSAWNIYTARKDAARSHQEYAKKTPKRNILFDVLSFFKSPITTSANTSHMKAGFVFVIAALSGALLGLCAYLILLSFIRNTADLIVPTALQFLILNGNEILFGLTFSLFAGAIVGVVLFLLYCASFYIINRLVFKDPTSFSEFLKGLSLCPIPLAVSGLLGAIFGLFSTAALVLILICAIIFTVILTYEVLKIKWSYKSSNQVLYATLLGFLLIGIAITSLIPIF